MNKSFFRKVKIPLTILLFILAVTVYIFNFISVNSKYTQPPIKINSINQEIIVQGLNFKITEADMLYSNEITSNSTLKELLAEYYSSSFENYMLILITAKLENRTGSYATFDFTSLHLESDPYSSQAFYPLMQYYNNVGMTLELNNMEKREIIIGFPVHKVSFRESDWINASSREYNLVYSLFPQKGIIPLSFEN